MKRADANADPDGLSALAAEAGIAEHWSDARQRAQRVAPDTLRALLAAMDLPAATSRDIQDSRQRLAAQSEDAVPPMIATRCNAETALPGAARGAGRRAGLSKSARAGRLGSPAWSDDLPGHRSSPLRVPFPRSRPADRPWPRPWSRRWRPVMGT